LTGALAVLLLVMTACGDGGGKENESGKEGVIHVVTTIAQIAEPISVIGGEHVSVQSLMGPGVDPHLYNATQGDIRKLDGSDLVLYSGLHLEGNMTEVFEQIGKTRPVVGIAEAISKDQLLHDQNGAVDPHVWFDIDLWKQALSSAVEELKKLAPDSAELFETNKNDYFKKLDELKTEGQAKLAEIDEEQRVLVTAHDAFGYFGRAYDVRVVGLQGLSTAAEIGLSDIDETIAILLEHQVPAVFIESSINPNSIKAVIQGAESKGLKVQLGGELYSDAMGDAGTPEGTYIGMYRHNIETIYNALKGKGE